MTRTAAVAGGGGGVGGMFLKSCAPIVASSLNFSQTSENRVFGHRFEPRPSAVEPGTAAQPQLRLQHKKFR